MEHHWTQGLSLATTLLATLLVSLFSCQVFLGLVTGHTHADKQCSSQAFLEWCAPFGVPLGSNSIFIVQWRLISTYNLQGPPRAQISSEKTADKNQKSSVKTYPAAVLIVVLRLSGITFGLGVSIHWTTGLTFFATKNHFLCSAIRLTYQQSCKLCLYQPVKLASCCPIPF